MSEEPVIIKVEWVDAHAGDPGWLTLEEYDTGGEEIVTTVGFWIKDTEPGGKADHLTVWQTLSSGDGIAPFHIPEVMVRQVTKLGVLTDLTHP